jgi:hypothetical protein
MTSKAFVGHSCAAGTSNSHRASPSLRSAIWDTVDPSGRWLAFEGSLIGWEAYYTVRAAVRKVFSTTNHHTPVTVSLLYLREADVFRLAGLAESLEEIVRRGHHFRVLLPCNWWCEILIPRLADPDSPSGLKRLPELNALELNR